MYKINSKNKNNKMEIQKKQLKLILQTRKKIFDLIYN